MSTIPQQVGTAPAQSTFVTVVAWVFLILSGGATLIGLLQSVMFSAMFYGDNGIAAEMSHDPSAATFARFMPLIFVAFCALSALMFAGSIGLLRRRNWGRLIVIGMLVLAIVYQLGSIALQQWVFKEMGETMPPEAYADGPGAQMQTMLQVFRFFMIGFSLAISGLFAWIIKRLVSPAIRAEFRPG